MPNERLIFRGLDQIPRGKASEDLIHGCLVLEGGAFRGLYTQGILDAMMLEDLNLDCVIGVSAGALSGVSYVSGQIGRSARVNLTYRHDQRYVGAAAFYKAHSLLDIGFLTEDRGVLEPTDMDRFNRKEQRFIVVATSVSTGQAVYFEKGQFPDMMKAVRASATMPYISPMVKIGDDYYMDGGCACHVPFQWAIDQGYEKIIVIRTRDAAYRKKTGRVKAMSGIYRRYPEFEETLAVTNEKYNTECDTLQELDRQGRLLQIAPPSPITVRRVEPNMEKLGALYFEGLFQGKAMADRMREYLGVRS